MVFPKIVANSAKFIFSKEGRRNLKPLQFAYKVRTACSPVLGLHDRHHGSCRVEWATEPFEDLPAKLTCLESPGFQPSKQYGAGPGPANKNMTSTKLTSQFVENKIQTNLSLILLRLEWHSVSSNILTCEHAAKQHSTTTTRFHWKYV